LSHGSNLWDKWKHKAHSELVYWDEIIRTKSNTWSNFFYIFVGYFSILCSIFDYYNHRQVLPQSPLLINYVTGNPPLSFLFGVACIHLGFASGLYHACLCYFGRQLDVASMYSPLMVLIAISLGRWSPHLVISSGFAKIAMPKWPIFSVIIVVSAYLFYEFKWYMDSSIILPTLIIITYGLAIADRIYFPHRSMNLKWMILSFIALIVGFTCRILDVNRMFFWFQSDSLVQGHAVWHLLTSASLYWMYLHHRSEPTHPAQIFKQYNTLPLLYLLDEERKS